MFAAGAGARAQEKGIQAIFRDAKVSSVSSNVYDFTDVNLGPATAGRVLVIGAGGRGAASGFDLTNVLMDTVATTEIVRSARVNANQSCLTAIAEATKTTALVRVNWGGTVARCGIGVWELVGRAGNVAAAGSDADEGAAPQVTLTYPDGAALIGFDAYDGGRDGDWLGVPSLFTSDFALDYSGGRIIGGHTHIATAGSRAVGHDGTYTACVMCAAAWGLP